MAISASQWSREATKATTCALYTTVAGILISLYGLYVEIRFEMDHDYTAMCDISSTVSCSRVLTSKYGTGFGIVAPLFGEDSFLNQKNALYGVMGYTILALIQLSHTRCSANVSFPVAILLNVMSFYLIINNERFWFNDQLIVVSKELLVFVEHGQPSNTHKIVSEYYKNQTRNYICTNERRAHQGSDTERHMYSSNLRRVLVILRAACLVCIAIYVVNALFLYFTVKRRRALVEVDNINNNKKRN